jgi:hypothetical protein
MRVKTLVSILGAFLVALGPAVVAAESAKPIERFKAFAVNMGSGNSGVVQIVIERWSTDAERDILKRTLAEKGPDALLGALQKIRPRTGYMRLPNTRGWDLYFARDVRREDGTRQVILATDRPISMAEARRSTRSRQYQFTLVDIRFDASGKGKGTLSTAAKLTINPKSNAIEVEDFNARPVDLINVASEKP